MSTVCHTSDSEQASVENGHRCKTCDHPFCHECGKGESTSSLDAEYPDQYCKPCLEKYAKDSLIVDDGFSPYATPLISPCHSLSSYGSCLSSFGDFLGDVSSPIREYSAESLDTFQRHSHLEATEHIEEHGNGSSFKDVDFPSSYAQSCMNGLASPISAAENFASNSLTEENYSSLTWENHEGGGCEKDKLPDSMVDDVQSTRVGDDFDRTENTADKNSHPSLPNFETDPIIWMPPEPEDLEDEMESVANNDDDDDYSDGTKWGQLSLSEEHGNSLRYKEERHKAMLEAMNGQFMILVSRLLASEGISFSDRDGTESWLSIVPSLSWEAALLVKPDASEGRAMDPGSYVKVKCIASGTREQSQVIKGLVFKKNTAHKHMPTKFENPRLLLLQGAVGHSALGLSSFKSMEQETDHLKFFNEMIDTCHPNVVLVEKTVSRDIQESLHAKGITLVFEMKLSRLERIARCTGSPIISLADSVLKPKLKQCDSFHIERVVEEHNGSVEGGKRPKTLLFLEGFPKPLGCTILLKGAHIDELKKVKRVMQFTVFAAYHLILETSFFADQRIFSSDWNASREGNDSVEAKPVPRAGGGAAPFSTISSFACDAATFDLANALDIPISNGSSEKYSHKGMPLISDQGADKLLMSPGFNLEVNSGENINQIDNKNLLQDKSSDGEIFFLDSLAPVQPGQLPPSDSASFKNYLGGSFPTRTSESLSSYFGWNDKVLNSQGGDLPISLSSEPLGHEQEATAKIYQKKSYFTGGENIGLVSGDTKSIEHCADVTDRVKLQDKDDIVSVLDPQSILILLSSHSITKQTVCEQSHLSRIKYYGNFDVSLGRYLQDILLNQKYICSSCGEPPEAHVYSFTHQNGNITVLVKQLPPKSLLSGEGEGKIWMWTRCLRCEHENGIPRSTKRVVMSTAARSLSFGKFLELSFSSTSAASRLSKCGHSLHRDCLRFFGLGSKVAMFRYSSVEIFAACKPPQVLEFHNPNGLEWLKREMRNVRARAYLFFSEVADLLKKLKPTFLGQNAEISGSAKEFCEAEKMLIQEKNEFEASLQKVIDDSVQQGMAASEVLKLNWLNQELLLELYIWDHRLHYLQKCIRECQQGKDADIGHKCIERNFPEDQEKILDASNQTSVDLDDSSSSNVGRHTREVKNETEIETVKISGDMTSSVHYSLDAGLPVMTEGHGASLLDQEPSTKPSYVYAPTGIDKDEPKEVSIPISDDMQVDQSIQDMKEPYLEKIELNTDKTVSGVEVSAVSLFEEQPRFSQESCMSKSDALEKWIWAPFSELRSTYRKEIHNGSLHRFETINTYTPSYLSSMHQTSNPEMDLLPFTVGPGGNVLSISEDEISSIIARALAIAEDRYPLLDKVLEKEAGECRREPDITMRKSISLVSNGSMASSYLSSAGSLESERPLSLRSFSSNELYPVSSEGSLMVDHQLASETHLEIPVVIGNSAGKSKYSVVCIYAKQFYHLRRKCCPSELAYISSLSRCKKWDAQGGKSKAFFAKSLDERFIIKQIKKTELESFLKFASDYFKHIAMSLDSGSQTCLAKILGIYQVTQNKNGKETRTVLMVMENLLFGHNISRTYDLKGAVFSRHVSDANDHEKVLLDQNFIEDMRISPIYVGGKTKHLLQRAIWNDTSFLTSINVMDYSLLVGVDKQRHQLVFGIIDYLRQYTWDKQLETWVKASLVVPKNSSPTIISPKEYKKRFRKFMTKYFLTVPDTWSSEQCSGPCKFCIAASSNSSKLNNEKLPEQPIEACA